MRGNRLVLLVALIAPAALAQSVRVPLTDLGARTYLGFPGGLYPGGVNAMPPAHLSAGLAAAAQVVPRDASGAPSPCGRVVMLSIGMSNTTQEWCAAGNPAPCDAWSFTGQAAADPAVNHDTLVVVNGASGGKTSLYWDAPTDPDYDRVRDTDLKPAGLTEAQVQVAWLKEANAGPSRSLPDAGADAWALEAQLGNVVRAMKTRYPNLKLVYLSSRIYAGYATTTLNPEPYAYETGFSVKWLVEAQIAQAAAGRPVDARAGDLAIGGPAPWLAWGPYLWADGTAPRGDGLTWERGDFGSDGTHPAESGRRKVGTLLLSFFKGEPTAAGWFLARPSGWPFTAAPCRSLPPQPPSVPVRDGLFASGEIAADAGYPPAP